MERSGEGVGGGGGTWGLPLVRQIIFSTAFSCTYSTFVGREGGGYFFSVDTIMA